MWSTPEQRRRSYNSCPAWAKQAQKPCGQVTIGVDSYSYRGSGRFLTRVLDSLLAGYFPRKTMYNSGTEENPRQVNEQLGKPNKIQ